MGDASNFSDFAAWYYAGLDQALRTSNGCREPYWTESIAVGSKDFVSCIVTMWKYRKRFESREGSDSAWYVRDPSAFLESGADE